MCYPDPVCRCCECQHKLCMMWHPGHSHRDDPRLNQLLITRLFTGLRGDAQPPAPTDAIKHDDMA
jgi:hypothetical protein